MDSEGGTRWGPGAGAGRERARGGLEWALGQLGGTQGGGLSGRARVRLKEFLGATEQEDEGSLGHSRTGGGDQGGGHTQGVSSGRYGGGGGLVRSLGNSRTRGKHGEHRGSHWDLRRQGERGDLRNPDSSAASGRRKERNASGRHTASVLCSNRQMFHRTYYDGMYDDDRSTCAAVQLSTYRRDTCNIRGVCYWYHP